VVLRAKHVLYHQGDSVDRLYFPQSGAISLLSVMPDGRCAEVGIVGSEGAVGVHVVYGVGVMPCEALVQADGEALVLPLEALRATGAAGGRLPTLLCRYAHALLLQTMQNAACNKLHTVRQRAARWILTMQDRMGGASLPLTQELLGTMLGVRRQSVNAVARSLQDAKVISYRHGQMVVRHRPRLEATACECYGTIRSHFSALLDVGAGTMAGCPCMTPSGGFRSDMSRSGQIAASGT